MLKKDGDFLLAQALAAYKATGTPQRLFTTFQSSQHVIAAAPVVLKAEANGQGINRRAVVTN